MKLTNRWNRFIYARWAPFYDALVPHLFRRGRERAMAALALRPGERVLLAGVGTGADLPLLPPGVQALGVDLSPEMLARAREKLPLRDRAIELREGDVQALSVESASFDAAILTLILSVVPDPRACLREVLRALRPGGRAVIFDKFLPEGSAPPLGRRIANLGSTLFGTDINRRLGDILADAPCELLFDEPSVFGGMFRVILLRRRDEPAAVSGPTSSAPPGATR